MKKRLSAFFLACILLCPMLTMPALADVTVYITKTGTKYHTATCSSLSKSKIAISLTNAKKRGYTPCEKCHPPTTSTHTHKWNSGKITKAATCTTTGMKTYTCTSCGATRTEKIPAKGHKWNSGKITKAATCTATGVKTYTCTVCRKTKTEKIPALGHAWDHGVVTVQPTETSDGVRVTTCTRCKAKKTARIPAIGYPFVDVPSDSFAWTPAKWAAENGITSGTTPTTFSPDKVCTRAQAVTFLWNAAGKPEAAGRCPFWDVSYGDWYYQAVLWAVENNITSGTSATTFSPNQVCNRAQIVTFMWNAEGQPDVFDSCIFQDIYAQDWYYQAVLWAVENNITSGTSAMTFSPKHACTRAQIVTFLYRYYA